MGCRMDCCLNQPRQFEGSRTVQEAVHSVGHMKDCSRSGEDQAVVHIGMDWESQTGQGAGRRVAGTGCSTT